MLGRLHGQHGTNEGLHLGMDGLHRDHSARFCLISPTLYFMMAPDHRCCLFGRTPQASATAAVSAMGEGIPAHGIFVCEGECEGVNVTVTIARAYVCISIKYVVGTESFQCSYCCRFLIP